MNSQSSTLLFLTVLCLFTLCDPSFRSPSTPRTAATRRSHRRRRRHSDGPSFIYIFQVIDGTGRLLFKVGYTNNIARRRCQWRHKCFPIKHKWCRRRFPTRLARRHGMWTPFANLTFLVLCRTTYSPSAASQRLSPYTRALFWGQMCVIFFSLLPRVHLSQVLHTTKKFLSIWATRTHGRLDKKSTVSLNT